MCPVMCYKTNGRVGGTLWKLFRLRFQWEWHGAVRQGIFEGFVERMEIEIL